MFSLKNNLKYLKIENFMRRAVEKRVCIVCMNSYHLRFSPFEFESGPFDIFFAPPGRKSWVRPASVHYHCQCVVECNKRKKKRSETWRKGDGGQEIASVRSNEDRDHLVQFHIEVE